MKQVRVSGVDFHVADEGSGPPLLLVHGFPLDHSMWRHQIEGLAGVCRVIAPDLRGFGKSGSATGTLTMEQLADDLAGLLDGLNIREPIVFCGLSMGGYVGWQFWRKYTERVRAFILCDTRAAADSEAAAGERVASAKNVLAGGLPKLADAMVGKLFSDATRRDQPQVIAATREVILRTPPEAVAAALRGMAARPDMREALSRVHVPALLLCGEDDPITPPAEMREMAAAMPAATYVEVPQAAHMAPLENPAVANSEMLQFLARISAGS